MQFPRFPCIIAEIGAPRIVGRARYLMDMSFGSLCIPVSSRIRSIHGGIKIPSNESAYFFNRDDDAACINTFFTVHVVNRFEQTHDIVFNRFHIQKFWSAKQN